MTFKERFIDSFQHYRTKVGLGKVQAFFRALYFELFRKEPWA